MANEAASEAFSRTMFGCMPLRLGILLTALWTFFTSLLFIGDRPLFDSLLRQCTGGYGFSSGLAISAVEGSGVLFGLIGIFGAWDTKRQYVLTYNTWQYARLAAWAYMFYIDVPLLLQCEGWVDNVKKASEQGWNEVMYNVAIHGGCPSERTRFFTMSTLTFIFFAYVMNSTTQYLEVLDRIPKHLNRVPKDLSSGIYYAKPLGDRSYLDGVDSEGAVGEEEYGTFNPAGLMKDPYGVFGGGMQAQQNYSGFVP